MRTDHDPDGLRLPIKLDTRHQRRIRADSARTGAPPRARPALEAAATERAPTGPRPPELPRLGLRRHHDTLASQRGLRGRGTHGGFYEIAPEAPLDLRCALGGGRQRVHLRCAGSLREPDRRLAEDPAAGEKPLQFATERSSCGPHRGPGDRDYLNCIGPDQFVKDVFMDSDTDLMVLSFVPSTRQDEPLTIEEAQATARIVEKLDGTHRLLIHGRVNPNQPGDLEGMDELASRHRISAWKTYTQWGPDGRGFFMDDEPGIR